MSIEGHPDDDDDDDEGKEDYEENEREEDGGRTREAGKGEAGEGSGDGSVRDSSILTRCHPFLGSAGPCIGGTVQCICICI